MKYLILLTISTSIYLHNLDLILAGMYGGYLWLLVMAKKSHSPHKKVSLQNSYGSKG